MESDESKASPTKPSHEDNDNNNLIIPDGGWGWVVCFAGFMINFSVAGITSSNGIILLGLVDHYGSTVSETALIGSLLMGAIMCAGPLALVLQAFQASHRQVIMIGGFIASLSTFVSAFVTSIKVLFFTFGITSGSTIGISYFAANTIVGSYFSKRRSLAIGIAVSGGGWGSVVSIYLIEKSISFYGMPGTFILISGGFLNFLVYGALCRPLKRRRAKQPFDVINNDVKKTPVIIQQNGVSEEKKDGTLVIFALAKDYEKCEEQEIPGDRIDCPSANKQENICKLLLKKLFSPKVFKNSSMLLLLTISFFWSAVEIALIYLPAKAVDVGLDRKDSAWIMTIYGIGLTFGEAIIGFLVDGLHIPASVLFLNALMGVVVGLGAFTFCKSFTAFTICTLLISITNGICIALRIVLVALILGVESLNDGYSTLSIAIGLGYFVYSYFTGILFDAVSASFNAVFFFASANLLMSTLMTLAISYRELKGRFRR